MSGVIKRQLEIGVDTCLLGFNAGKQYIKSVVFDASSLLRGTRGTSEVQSVTISGAPTGGTFILGYKGEKTTAIAYNAVGSTIQGLLEALPEVGLGDIHVTGSAGGPYTVTFLNSLAGINQPNLEHEDSLTGGTSPKVTVAQVTEGSQVGYDPRIAIGVGAFPGTIVRKEAGTPEMVVEYDGTGTIYGVIDGFEEFMDNSVLASRDMPAIVGPGAVFDASKIKNYSTYKTAFLEWAKAQSCLVENQ